MYILISITFLYLLFLFLSSEGGAAQWVRGKTTQFIVREEGQSLTEAALLMVLIAILLIIILTLLGQQVGAIFCVVYYELGGSEFAKCTEWGVPSPTP